VSVTVTGGNVKVVLGIVVALLAVGALAIVWFGGLAVGLRHNYNTRLSELGLNRRTAALYSRAVRLMKRLDQEEDLSGAMAGDVLSPETREQVKAWVSDQGKEVRRP
jgi:hypothetical protein